MALTQERKGEIALLLVKDRMKKDGIRLKTDTRREIGNTAKDIGIPMEEAVMFTEEIVRELVEEAFKPRTSTKRVPESIDD